jgi:hypothetical protein
MSEEGGFDVAAYRRGGNPDKALLVTFEWAAQKQPDGSFKNIEMIRIWLGRNDEIVRPVIPEDKVRFSDRYEAFRKGEAVPETGTPIAQCAFATPADISACKSERIFTLEQLVETADERLQRSRLVTFKYRCRDWLESQKRHGYVGELRVKIDALEKENATLKLQLAERGIEPVEDEAPKRRGRPPKVKDADAQAVNQ